MCQHSHENLSEDGKKVYCGRSSEYNYDDDDNSASSEDSIDSTMDDESFEEPSCASEAEEEPDFASTSFISSRVLPMAFMSVGRTKQARTRCPQGRGKSHIRDLPSVVNLSMYYC